MSPFATFIPGAFGGLDGFSPASGPHDFTIWKNDLYPFAQRLFRP